MRNAKTRVGICCGHLGSAKLCVDYLLSAKFTTPHSYLDASMLPLVANSLGREKLAKIVWTTGQKGSFFPLGAWIAKARSPVPFWYITNILCFN